jgi:DNA-binding transcriptional ArsR family regulator
VGEISGQLKMTISAVSHQLSGLRRMKLVRSRKAGRQVFYALDDDHVAKLYLMGLDHVEHG